MLKIYVPLYSLPRKIKYWPLFSRKESLTFPSCFRKKRFRAHNCFRDLLIVPGQHLIQWSYLRLVMSTHWQSRWRLYVSAQFTINPWSLSLLAERRPQLKISMMYQVLLPKQMHVIVWTLDKVWRTSNLFPKSTNNEVDFLDHIMMRMATLHRAAKTRRWLVQFACRKEWGLVRLEGDQRIKSLY